MKIPHERSVTLEDLLRLKRAERPSAEFWTQFERDLRQKQLAAILVRRPWWAPMLRGWVRFAHLQLPVGATAILALTFLAVRQYNVVNVGTGIAPVVAHTASVDDEIATHRSFIAPTEKVAQDTPSAAAVTHALDIDQPARMPSLGDVAHVVPLLDSPAPALDSPSARSIAANLAAAQVIDPELAETLAGPMDMSSRTSSASGRRMDPLARISKPSDARRARLLAGSLPASPMYATASLSSDDTTHERINSRLEDRLYDSVHRFEADGRSVSIKF